MLTVNNDAKKCNQPLIMTITVGGKKRILLNSINVLVNRYSCLLHIADANKARLSRRRCELSWRQLQAVFSSSQYIGD